MFNIDFSIKNGWILTVAWVFMSYFPMFFGGKAAKRLTSFDFMGKNGWIYSTLIFICSIVFLAIPVFTKITDSRSLLLVGFAIFGIGTIGTFISYHNYFTTPLDQLITKGLYKISRNPIYVSVTIATAGIAVLCTSYIMGAALILNLLFQHPVILEEERFCSKNYGNEFEDYKKQTRRYL